MIKDVAFTAYPCADVASARAWYERHLGLQFMGPYNEDGMEKYNEANIGSACFSLMWYGWMDAAAGTGNGIVFEVDDIERSVDDLRDAGISVDEVYESPMCKSTSLRDPEGNRITLHEINASRRVAGPDWTYGNVDCSGTSTSMLSASRVLYPKKPDPPFKLTGKPGAFHTIQ